ncbi:MAG: hypothetical protein ACJA01_002670, partial [Saprospiraceae bacterium]
SSNDVKEHNKKGLSSLNVDYQALKKNIGRSSIRNRLITKAHYEYLLFIDSDHKIISSEYISNYLRNSSDSTWTFLCGGTAYAIDQPNSDKMLHWEYGKKREAIPAKKRTLHSANHVHTNNLLIRKSHLDNIRLDESIIGYGYEDLVFGQQIKNAGKTILHIDNPLLHLGLKTNENFLLDLKQASSNLAFLYTQSKVSDLRIIQITERLKTIYLLFPIKVLLTYLEPVTVYLLKRHPKQLFLADLLKLLYFAKMI